MSEQRQTANFANGMEVIDPADRMVRMDENPYRSPETLDGDSPRDARREAHAKSAGVYLLQMAGAALAGAILFALLTIRWSAALDDSGGIQMALGACGGVAAYCAIRLMRALKKQRPA